MVSSSKISHPQEETVSLINLNHSNPSSFFSTAVWDGEVPGEVATDHYVGTLSL